MGEGLINQSLFFVHLIPGMMSKSVVQIKPAGEIFTRPGYHHNEVLTMFFDPVLHGRTIQTLTCDTPPSPPKFNVILEVHWP